MLPIYYSVTAKELIFFFLRQDLSNTPCQVGEGTFGSHGPRVPWTMGQLSALTSFLDLNYRLDISSGILLSLLDKSVLFKIVSLCYFLFILSFSH